VELVDVQYLVHAAAIVSEEDMELSFVVSGRSRSGRERKATRR
jgi:hypothetical protein